MRSSILVESGGDRVLVDCGPDLRQQLIEANVSRLDKVIVTHDHADHCHGIDELRQVSHHLGHAVPLLARAHTLTRLAKRFAYIFEGTPLYPAVVSSHPIEGEAMLGAMKLEFVDQPHGGITSLGIRATEGSRSMGYAIDFNEFTDEMRSLYYQVDLWICDCLRETPHPTHAHLEAVLDWARELKVGQLVLTHLDKSMDYATLVAKLPDWAAPAYDGQEFVL